MRFYPVFEAHDKKENIKPQDAKNKRSFPGITICFEFRQTEKNNQTSKWSGYQQLTGNVIMNCPKPDRLGSIA
jgi:hypothetical protein